MTDFTYKIQSNPYCCGSYLVGNVYPPIKTAKDVEDFTEILKRKTKEDFYKTFFYWTLTSRQVTEETLEELYKNGWLLLAESKSAHGNYPIYHLGFITMEFNRG